MLGVSGRRPLLAGAQGQPGSTTAFPTHTPIYRRVTVRHEVPSPSGPCQARIDLLAIKALGGWKTLSEHRFADAAEVIELIWSRGRELNPRPTDYESVALPLSYPGVSTAYARDGIDSTLLC